MKKQKNSEINRVPVVDAKGKKVDTVELDKDIFNGKFNEGLLYQSIVMYNANKRRGVANTKTRADVRGGGKKPWRQKGTGRARFGSIRNPLWRGGGIAFGPHPRDFRYDLPKKLKRNAFTSSINAKLADGEIFVIEELSVNTPKTKELAAKLRGIKSDKGILILLEEIDRNLRLASRNIKNITLKKFEEATALDVLSNEKIVMTKKAVGSLGRRVKR